MAKKTQSKKTIYDIAEEAGVSTATISRVLNNSPKVDYHTRLKILEILDRYNYKPKVIKNKVNHIGIIIDINEDGSVFFGQYIVGLVEGIIKYAYQNNLETSIIPFEQNKIPYPEEITAFLMERDITGAIFINPSTDADYIYALDKINFPYIVIGSHFSSDMVNSIDIENYSGMKAAIDYLYELGHRKIGFLNVNNRQYAFTKRNEIYKEILNSKNIPIDENFILVGESSNKNHKEVGFDMIMNLEISKSKLPSTFLCLNDDIAVGAMKGFSKRGIKVPDDISIIGFDDYPDSKFYAPALTTIKNPLHDMGYMACENVERWIKGRKQKIQKLFETELIIRESCKHHTHK